MNTGLSVDQMFSLLLSRLDAIEGKVVKGNVKDTWLDEKTAAGLLGYHPRTFRRKVISNEIPVHYRTSNGRKYEYNHKDIMRYKEDTSTVI